LPIAVERMKAARGAIDASGADVLLVGRAECFLVGHAEPLKESIRRLRAYAEAGADVLFAPGVRERAEAGVNRVAQARTAWLTRISSSMSAAFRFIRCPFFLREAT